MLAPILYIFSPLVLSFMFCTDFHFAFLSIGNMKGFFRYWNPTIKKLLSELSQAESDKESALKSILQRLIKQFCEHHIKWRQLVSATAGIQTLLLQIGLRFSPLFCDILQKPNSLF